MSQRAGELELLAARKAAVRRRIGAARRECVDACDELAPKLRIADAIWSNWRLISPLVGIGGAAVGIFRRKKPSVLSRLSSIVRWAPLAIRTVRAVSAMRRA